MASEVMGVSDYQGILKSLGIYKGRVDGIKGPLTLAAIRGFQRINRLPATGTVDARTARALVPDPIPHRDSTIPTDWRPTPWPNESDCLTFYGPMGANLTMLELPFKMRLAWKKTEFITRFSIHEKVHDSAKRCFDRIYSHFSPAKLVDLGITLFGGCISSPPRKKRGGSTWSMHSWGIAIDFDPARNPLHGNVKKARLMQPDAEPFWRIWEEEGWISLGRMAGFDPMHIQAARLG